MSTLKDFLLEKKCNETNKREKKNREIIMVRENEKCYTFFGKMYPKIIFEKSNKISNLMQ